MEPSKKLSESFAVTEAETVVENAQLAQEQTDRQLQQAVNAQVVRTNDILEWFRTPNYKDFDLVISGWVTAKLLDGGAQFQLRLSTTFHRSYDEDYEMQDVFQGTSFDGRRAFTWMDARILSPTVGGLTAPVDQGVVLFGGNDEGPIIFSRLSGEAVEEVLPDTEAWTEIDDVLTKIFDARETPDYF